MPIRFGCKCGKKFKVNDALAGKKAKCPGCGATVVVPLRQEPEPGLKPGPQPTRKAEAPPLELAPPAPVKLQPREELKIEPLSPGPAEPAPGAGGRSLEDEPTLQPSRPIEPDDAQPQEPAAGPIALSLDDLGGGADVPPPEAKPEPVPEPAKKSVTETPVSERQCPKCGAGVAPDARICVECGNSLETGPKPEKALKDDRKKRKMSLLVLAAALLLLLGVAAGIVAGAWALLSSKPEKEPPKPVAAKPKPPPPKPKPKKKPPKKTPARPKPAPVVKWTGFSDPLWQSRARLSELGRTLAAYHEQNSTWPASLPEAGFGAEEAATFTYFGPDVASLKRLAPVAHEPTSGDADRFHVLFNDGSVRPVARRDLAAIVPEQRPEGWLTPADMAFLAKVGPHVTVSNRRFSSLEVTVDGTPAGTVSKGATTTFTVSPGKHRIAFKAGDIGEAAVEDTFEQGLTYAYAYLKHRELALIPLRLYKEVFGNEVEGYAVEKDGFVIKSLQGPDETVEFGARGGRAALAQDPRSITARITRGDLCIEGVGGNPITINKLSRMENGAIRHKNGHVVRYRGTALGTLAAYANPRMTVAPLARISLAAASAPSGTRGGPSGRALERRRPARGRGTTAAVEPVRFPDLVHRAAADCEALADVLADRGAKATALLLGRATAAPTAAPTAAGTRVVRGRREPGRQRAGGRGGRDSRGRRQARRWDVDSLPLDPTVPGQDLKAADVFAALAVYGDAAAVAVLPSLSEKRSVGDPGYRELLLALARCGGKKALAHIGSAAQNAPVAAAIAVSMIDDVAARTALDQMVAEWTAADIAQTAAVWPAVAGPRSRRRFVEQIAESNPPALEEAPALNALLKIEPYALEHVLLARLRVEVERELSAGKMAAHAKKGEPKRRAAGKRGPGRAEAEVPAAPPSWRVLGRLRNAEAVTLFLRLLKAGNASLKHQALAALAETRDPSLVPVMAAGLSDSNQSVRLAAAGALVKVGNAAAVKELTARMTPGLANTDILKSVRSLGRTAGREATARLLARMLEVSVESAPPAAPKKGKASRPKRGPAPRRPGGKQQKEEKAVALPERILAAMAGLGVKNDAVKAALDKAAGASNPAVRSAAYRAQAALTRPARRGSLLRGVIKLLPIAPVTDRVPALAGRVPRMGSSTWSKEVFQRAFADKDDAVRAAGFALMKGAPPAEAMPFLTSAIHEKSPKVRAAALAAIPKLSGPDPRTAMLIAQGLQDPDAAVVKAAGRAAGQADGKGAGPVVRMALVSALNTFADPEKQSDVLPVLIASAAAMRAQATISSLVQLLNHERAEVRAAAATALGVLGNASDVVPLTSALNDAEPAVSAAALSALTRFDTAAAVRELKNGLRAKTFPEGVRLAVLGHLLRSCAKGRPYATWAQTTNFSDAELARLAEAARAAPSACAGGILLIAPRYLDGDDPKMRGHAAAMLVPIRNDPRAYDLTVAALKKDPNGIEQAAAEVLRAVRDKARIRPLKALHRSLFEEKRDDRKRPGKRPQARPSRDRPARGSRPRAKPSAEDMPGLSAAIIEALGAIGGDKAAQAVWTVTYYDKRDTTRERVLQALKATNSRLGVVHIARFAGPNDPLALKAVQALDQVGYLSPDVSRAALQRLIRSAPLNFRLTAAASDALDTLASKRN